MSQENSKSLEGKEPMREKGKGSYQRKGRLSLCEKRWETKKRSTCLQQKRDNTAEEIMQGKEAEESTLFLYPS